MSSGIEFGTTYDRTIASGSQYGGDYTVQIDPVCNSIEVRFANFSSLSGSYLFVKAYFVDGTSTYVVTEPSMSASASGYRYFNRTDQIYNPDGKAINRVEVRDRPADGISPSLITIKVNSPV